jgi:NADH-quinone oxidoreductase subunit L
VSQLAYMFGALAVGAYSAGVLHLLAHGAFKALLFLAAGSVVHAVGSTSMSAMGGLRDKLPDTFITMTIGFGALAGVVPLVGFFTKDAAIGAAWDAARHGHLVWPWVAWVLFISAVVTALLTVAYSLRAWLMVFFTAPVAVPAATEAATDSDVDATEDEGGFDPSALLQPTPEPGTPAAAEPHESGWSMRTPLYLLTIPTVFGGLLVAYPELAFGEGEHHLLHPELAIVMTLLVAATGVGVFLLWRRSEGRDPWHPFALPHPAVDKMYDLGIVRPVEWLARGVRAGDRDVIDAYADGAGATTRGLGWLLRRAQAGNVQTYLMVVVVGACALAVAAGVTA